MRPQGKLLGVETERLALGQPLKANQAYRVETQLKHGGLEKGVFAFSMYCFDERGKALKQLVFHGIGPQSKPHDWRRVVGYFGPGTANPLPDGTKSVCRRFSFYEKKGDCRGLMSAGPVIVAPCTGNTLAKLALGVTDTPVAMAVKSQLRNGRPVLIGISTNDGLSNSAKNIGILLERKSVFFVPFAQDDPMRKPTSLMLDVADLRSAALSALHGEQLQPELKMRDINKL
jgi:dipicolinate synthase subunit B